MSNPAGVKGAYRELRLALQILQWQDPSRRGQHWILKSPTHMSAPMTLLDAFPGALIIQTHRDPLRTVPSHCSMITPLFEMKSDSIPATDIGRFTSRRWAEMSNDVIDLSDRIGNKRESWSPHVYDLETYGLSEEIIKSDYARYRERHCS